MKHVSEELAQWHSGQIQIQRSWVGLQILAGLVQRKLKNNASVHLLLRVIVARSNREVQHVNKPPGFTLVVGLEVSLLFSTKNLTPL